MSVQIGNLNLQLAQAQAENDDLKKRNFQLQKDNTALRKEVHKHESSGNQPTNQQD